MDNQTPRNNENNTAVAPELSKKEHSGNAPDGMREGPVETFGKTDLENAPLTQFPSLDPNNEHPLEADFLEGNTPIGEYVIPEPTVTERVVAAPEQAKPKLRNKVIAGLAGVAILAGGLFGITALTQAPKSEPVATAPAEPNPEVTTPTEVEPAGFEVVGLPTVSELEISAEQTDEAIAQNIVAVFSSWGMAGANEDMEKLRGEGDNGYLSLPEYIDKISGEINPVYAEAVYGTNATSPEFSEAIGINTSQNKEILTAHFQTYGNQNLAPYHQNLNFVSMDNVVVNGDGTKTISVTVEREDNGDANIVDGTGNGYRMEGTFIINDTNGTIHLSQPASFTAK